MAKGGGLAAGMMAVAGAGCAGLYLAGKLPGFGQGASALPDTKGVKPPAQVSSGVDFLSGHLVLLGVSAVLAVLAVTFWRRIGGFGRATLLVLAAIAATGYLLASR